MIADAEELSEHTPLHADLCIVGAGPAGIALAREAARRGLSILLLDSGGLEHDPASEALNAGEASAAHPPLTQFRRRGLGGATAIWGGRCTPLDAHDFTPRLWLGPKARWPISARDLLPYWEAAAAFLEIGRPDFHAATAVPGGMRPMLPGLLTGPVHTHGIERFSRPTHTGRKYLKELRAHPRIRLILRATCTSIALDRASGRQVRHVELRAASGRTLRARARHFVIAAGGIETPRLLLASNDVLPDGIGNAHDQVGRHYMCHIAGTTGLFTPAPDRPRPFHGYDRDPDGVYCRRRFSIAPETQRALSIGNAIARLHHGRAADPAHRSGPLSALYMARSLLPAEYRTRLADAPAHAWPGHAGNIARAPGQTLAFAAFMVRNRVIARRKFPSVIVNDGTPRFALDVHAEQIPDEDSRITLAAGRDRFGVRLPRVDWRCSEADLRTARVTVALIARALRQGGFGTLGFTRHDMDRDMLADGAYGGHHLGGARMASSPRTGVTDADCRVHGTDNLFVAGGALFATSGQANPTLTIVALALRLADHLAGGRTDPVAAGAALELA